MLGKRICNLRKNSGLSQEQLAEHLKVSRQTISNWELGETAPNPEQLKLLSKVFHISIDKLVGNDFIEDSITQREFNETKYIYIGFSILGASLGGLWSFTANRFTQFECLSIVFVGLIAGLGLGIVCQSITAVLKKR